MAAAGAMRRSVSFSRGLRPPVLDARGTSSANTVDHMSNDMAEWAAGRAIMTLQACTRKTGREPNTTEVRHFLKTLERPVFLAAIHVGRRWIDGDCRRLYAKVALKASY